MDVVASGGGGEGAPGGGGGRGGGGRETWWVASGASLGVRADIGDGSEVVMEEVVQLLSSLLQLSGSLVADEQLITSSTRINTQLC